MNILQERLSARIIQAPTAMMEQWEISRDVRFRQRVAVAMCTQAISVQDESTVIPNHTNRANYAKRVLNHPKRYTGPFALAICAYDSSLTPDSSDAAINNAVAAVWNALAGTV